MKQQFSLPNCRRELWVWHNVEMAEFGGVIAARGREIFKLL